MKTTLSATKRNALLLAALLLAPSLAHAHVGVGETSGFSHGFGHPLSGLDHICAMVAVGLWAAQMGGRSIWAVPLTFVAVMAFGGFLGAMGVSLPFVEKGSHKITAQSYSYNQAQLGRGVVAQLGFLGGELWARHSAKGFGESRTW